MAFAINTNVASLQAQNSLRITGDLQSKTINRVTSGLRIVASGDDAAGLAIANTYRSDGAVISVVGDVTREGIRRDLAARLSGWVAPAVPRPAVPQAPASPPRHPPTRRPTPSTSGMSATNRPVTS